MQKKKTSAKDNKSTEDRRELKKVLEKNRRSKLTGLILRLYELLPQNTISSQCHVDILTVSYNYMKQLRKELDNVKLGHVESIHSEEIKRLRNQIKVLERKCETYEALLDIAGISRHTDAATLSTNSARKDKKPDKKSKKNNSGDETLSNFGQLKGVIVVPKPVQQYSVTTTATSSSQSGETWCPSSNSLCDTSTSTSTFSPVLPLADGKVLRLSQGIIHKIM